MNLLHNSVDQSVEMRSMIKNVKVHLNEWASRGSIVDAINNKDVVTIYYDSPLDTTNNRGYRTIEPYVLGTSKAGNLVLRAWQQAGSTDSENPEGWRLFRLEGIKVFYKTFKKFESDDEFLKVNRPNYNQDDRDMSSIIAAVDPNGGVGQELGASKSINKPDITVTKANPSIFKTQADKLKSFYSRPTHKLDMGWFDKIKNKFLSDINKQDQNF